MKQIKERIGVIVVIIMVLIVIIMIAIVYKEKKIETIPPNIKSVDESYLLIYEHIDSKKRYIGYRNDEYYLNGEYIELGSYECINKCIGYNVIGDNALISDNGLIIYDFVKNGLDNLDLTINSDYAFLVGYNNVAYGIVYAEGIYDKYYSLETKEEVIAYSGYLSVEESPSLKLGYILGINVASKESKVTNHYDLINIKTGKIIRSYIEKNSTNCESASILGNEKQQYIVVNTKCSAEAKYRIYNDKYKSILGDKTYDFFRFDKNGNIYLANYKDNYIIKYNSKGIELSRSKKYNQILFIGPDNALVVDDGVLKVVNYSDKVIKELMLFENTFKLHYHLALDYEDKITFYIENMEYEVYKDGRCIKYEYNKKTEELTSLVFNTCPSM